MSHRVTSGNSQYFTLRGISYNNPLEYKGNISLLVWGETSKLQHNNPNEGTDGDYEFRIDLRVNTDNHPTNRNLSFSYHVHIES